MKAFRHSPCYNVPILLFFLLVFALTSKLYAEIPDASGNIYVNINVVGGDGSGNSWSNATKNLQAAIDAPGVIQVFVAHGTYEVPSPNSFVMKEGVAIYGGFAPEKGVILLNMGGRIMPGTLEDATILSGKNERPVIWNYNNALTRSAILDGFVITGGKALNGVSGGGIYNRNVSPTLRNLVIKRNAAVNGAGIYNENSAPSLFGIAIVDNSATGQGGGIYNLSGTPELTNVTIAGNTAQTGKAVYSLAGTPVINNSIVFGDINGNYSASYSLIENSLNTNDHNLNGSGIKDAHVFVNPAHGNYTLVIGSPAINQGYNAYSSGLMSTPLDLAGHPREGAGANSTIDLGAYEYMGALPSAEGIVYVRPGAVGGGDRWGEATGDLQSALAAPGVRQVFVAIGNYEVSASSFVMKKGVAIYGGFDPDNGIDDLTKSRVLPDQLTEGSVLSGRGERPVIWNIATIDNPMDTTAVLDGFTLTQGNGSDGGAIYNENASPKLLHLVIKNSTANNGGGIYNNGASPKLVSCRFFDNHTTQLDGQGGAICNKGASPRLINCLFYNNRAYFGGAIANIHNAYPNLINCTLASNRADGYAGAVYSLDMSYPVFINCLVYGNTANLGSAGIRADATTTPIYASLIQEATTFDANENVFYNGALTDLFNDPASNDYTLKVGGPAINMGRNNSIATQGVNTDLSGHPRIQANSVDLGAFEADACATTPIIYVDAHVNGRGSGSGPVQLSSSTGNGASWATAYKNLSDALSLANSCPNVTEIRVAAGAYYPTGTPGFSTNRNQSFVLTRSNLKILGGYNASTGFRDVAANPTFLTCEPTAPSYHLVIMAEVPGTDSLILDGFQLTGAVADNEIDYEQIGSASFVFNDVGAGLYMTSVGANVVIRNCSFLNNNAATGAGVYSEIASVTFDHCTFTGNSVTPDTYYPGFGGGMYATGSNIKMTGCLFDNNSSAGDGGALFGDNATIDLTNCNFTQNLAGGNGGGLYNSFGNSALLNCLFSKNTAAGSGAAIYNSSASPVLTNVALVDNHATGNGGACYIENGAPMLTNITIAGNTAGTGAAAFFTNGSLKPTFYNSIVYGDLSGGYTASYSLMEADPGGASGNLDGTKYKEAAVFANPTAGDYTLFDASAAVNKGSNLLYSGLGLETKDLQSNPRVYKGLTIDLGAYEYQGEPAALPVTLIDFKVTKVGAQARLQWQTANELATYKFEIYRSVNGLDYKKLGELEAKGSAQSGASYVWEDLQPISGANSYRLTQVDQNGQVHNLGVRTLTFSKVNATIHLYPNPTRDNLVVKFPADTYTTLELWNAAGRNLNGIHIAAGVHQLQMGLAAYPAGVYLMKLSGKGGSVTQKIIKQ